VSKHSSVKPPFKAHGNTFLLDRHKVRFFTSLTAGKWQRGLRYRVPTLLLTKNPGLFQDFPGPPWIISQDMFGACECLYIKKKTAFTYNIQNAKGGKIHQHSTPYSSKQLSTQTRCYTIAACLRNRPPLEGGCVYVLQMFFCFFPRFFLSTTKIPDNCSRERLNGFSWNFYQTIPGKIEFATSCRRLANVDLRNLRYDSGIITRRHHARRLRLQMHERANGFNLVFHLNHYKIAWLSRIFFQDFPGPKLFSRTFQVIVFSRKKPGPPRRSGNPAGEKSSHLEAVEVRDTAAPAVRDDTV